MVNEKVSKENSQAMPWYEKGLCFSCKRCGNCCSGGPGYVWVSLDEIRRIEEYLKSINQRSQEPYLRKVNERYSLTEKSQGDCVFLKREGEKTFCSIHPVKPHQCRTWPFWDTVLANREIWEEMSQTCPGINQGKRYNMKEIQEIQKEKC